MLRCACRILSTCFRVFSVFSGEPASTSTSSPSSIMMEYDYLNVMFCREQVPSRYPRTSCHAVSDMRNHRLKKTRCSVCLAPAPLRAIRTSARFRFVWKYCTSLQGNKLIPTHSGSTCAMSHLSRCVCALLLSKSGQADVLMKATPAEYSPRH